jgi:hypothetical protein
MTTRRLKGKTIRKVHQVLWESNTGKVWVIDAIEFTDGSVLRLMVVEGEADYGIIPIYPARAIDS